VARLMKATSQFGVEFDSLADVVSFCVAPAFLLYSYALKDLGRPAWFGAEHRWLETPILRRSDLARPRVLAALEARLVLGFGGVHGGQ